MNVRCLVGVTLLGASFVGVLVCALAIIDPSAAKLADDADPFGNPPRRLGSSLMLLGYGGLGTLAALTLRNANKR